MYTICLSLILTVKKYCNNYLIHLFQYFYSSIQIIEAYLFTPPQIKILKYIIEEV